MNTTQNQSMSSFAYLSGKWWILLLRGLCGILFGILAFFWPNIALFSIVLVYGAFILLDGILAIGASFTTESGETARRNWKANRWWLMLVGVIGLLAGLLMLFNPFFGAVIIIACVGLWSLMRGVLELFWYVKLHKGMANGGWLLFDAIISLLFGALVLVWPAASAIAITWGLGIFALITGLMQVGFAWQLRKSQIR